MPEPKMGLAALAQRAFTGTRERWRTQLTSATVLGQIRHEDEPVPAFNFDEARVASANDLVRLAELERTPRERRTDPGQLPDVAQTYADLAAGSLPGDPRRAELLALASSTWSLAGYQANSVALARQYQEAIDYAVGAAPLSAQVTTSAAPASIAAIVAAVLVRDVAEVARLGAASRAAVGELGQRMVAEAQGQPLDQADAAVLAAYGLTGRAAQRLSRFWLAGDQQAGEEAVATLRRASGILLQAGVVDTWSLVDNLGHVVEDLVATSPWRLLRRATSWNGRWTRYLRWLARDERPVVQVWPSQQEVLRSGLFDPSRPNLAVTMPTSAGKTNVAEWAILDALAASGADPFFRPLVVYVVPTRALAAQVERQLRGTLQRLGLTVSAVFGGWEHVEYELQLIDTTDALVATSEKLDLLLRNDPSLARRLALVVADEGHLLGEPVRGLRLELVLTHLRRIAPTARLLVLSAVLPNVDHIAEWIDPGLGDHNAIEVTWTPSRIRLGVFSWTGPNQDGQRGAVRYRPGDVDHGFFLPYVITRRKKLKNLYPSQPKDIAAELALHYERLGSVLVAAPTKPSARAVAGAVTKLSQKRGVDFGARGGAARPVEATELRQRAVDAVREYAGTGHELEAMVAVGVAYHHADVPEVIRHAIEDAFRGGAIRVLCATSTLGQGVNLPAKTVIVESTWRGQGDQIPVRDFWNVAGRAARPFQETDGHVILVAKTQSDVAKLNGRYLTTPTLEPVNSSLLRLYVALAKRRLPGLRRFEDVPEDLEFVDTDLNADERRLAEAFDMQLLTLLGEETFETEDENELLKAVSAAIGATFCAAQLRLANGPIAPLVRFAASRARAVVRRVPDRDLRQVYVRTGLSLSGCETALQAAQTVNALIEADPELLGVGRWPELLVALARAAMTVVEAAEAGSGAGIEPGAVPQLVRDWVAGMPIDELRHAHEAHLRINDPMKFATSVDRVVVNTLSWVISSVVQLIQHLRNEPLVGPMTFASAMVKFGVDSAPACYAASMGVRRRSDAQAIAALCPLEAASSLPGFLRWVSGLAPADLRGHVSDATIAMFTEKAAASQSPPELCEIAVIGSGAVTVPLRGIAHAGSAGSVNALADSGALSIRRDASNSADPNAIEVLTQEGRERLGYVAREAARVIAPLMDLGDGVSVTAALASRPDPTGSTLSDVEDHDAVSIRITVVDDGDPTYRQAR